MYPERRPVRPRPRIDPGEGRRLHNEEKLSPSVKDKRLGIAGSSVYRFLSVSALPVDLVVTPSFWEAL